MFKIINENNVMYGTSGQMLSCERGDTKADDNVGSTIFITTKTMLPTIKFSENISYQGTYYLPSDV